MAWRPGSAACAGSVGALFVTAPAGWTDIKKAITASISWDVSLVPKQQAIYLQRGSLTPALLPRCMGSNATPDPCLRSYSVGGGNQSSPGYGDRTAQILFTSDVGYITVGQP